MTLWRHITYYAISSMRIFMFKVTNCHSFLQKMHSHFIAHSVHCVISLGNKATIKSFQLCVSPNRKLNQSKQGSHAF